MSLNAPLHIAVDALGTPTGGGVTFVQNVLSEMSHLRPGTRFTLFYSSNRVASAEYPDNVSLVDLPQCGGLIRRWLWEQACLPGELRRIGADVLINMNGFTSFPCRLPQIAIWQNAHVMNRARLGLPRNQAIVFWIQRQLHRASAWKATRNVFLTRHLADLAAELWPVHRAQRSIVHSGIDPRRIAIGSGDGAERAHRAVSVGHTYVHKNYEALIDAMAIYQRRYSDDLELWIVGDVWDAGYHASLVDRIEQSGVAARIKLTGPMNEQAVADIYSSSAIYVTTSILESFGLTTLEAMANDLPVLAPQASCFPEVCGNAALYCDPHDPEDIAEQMHRLIFDSELRAELRQHSIERIRHFSWIRCAEELYGEVDAAVSAANKPAAADRSSGEAESGL